MEPAEGIGTLGFGRWYERQLIYGHAYLVTCFLCIVVLAASLELLGPRASRIEQALTAAFLVGIVFLGLHSLRRYRDILIRAENFARAATCGTCRTYGSIRVEGTGSTAGEAPEAERAHWVKVRCRRCGNAWTIG
jgi:ribosomal protein S27E